MYNGNKLYTGWLTVLVPNIELDEPWFFGIFGITELDRTVKVGMI